MTRHRFLLSIVAAILLAVSALAAPGCALSVCAPAADLDAAAQVGPGHGHHSLVAIARGDRHRAVRTARAGQRLALVSRQFVARVTADLGSGASRLMARSVTLPRRHLLHPIAAPRAPATHLPV